MEISVLDLGPMYATDRRQTLSDVRQTSDAHHRLIASSLSGWRHNDDDDDDNNNNDDDQ